VLGKILLIGGAGIVGLGAVADIAVRGMAESRIADRAEEAAGGQARARADIDSFPFVLRLLAGGKVGDVTLHVDDVATPSVRLASVDLELEGVKVDRAKLLSDRTAEVTDVELARITVHIDSAVVERALGGLQVSFRGGTVQASIGGRTVSAAVAVAPKGQLGITFPGGPSASIPLPRTDLVACEGGTFRFEADELLVECSTTEVPPALLRAAQR
jgi:hypothetical protein